MARGFLSGMIAGGVVSGLALGTASVLTEIPGMAPPEATALEVPAGSEFDLRREDTEAQLPRVEDQPEAGGVPQVSPPQPDDLSRLSGADTEPTARPETGEAESQLRAPAQDGETGVSVETESPVLPNPQAVAPELPTAEEDLSISTDPAQPAMPDLTGDTSAFPDPAPDAVEPEASMPEAFETPGVAGALDVAPAPTPPTEDDVIASQETAPAPQPAPEPASEAPEPETVPASEPASPAPDEAPAAELPAMDEDGARSDETADAGERTLPSGTIGNLAPNVRTNRLPSISGAAAPEPEAEPAAAESAAGVAQGRAIERHAEPFENPEGKPVMAIVLIDDGKSSIGLDALATFPYPLSFAIDAAANRAPIAMERYRAAGVEVLAMIDLPQLASASDTEVAMQEYLARIPEAVAVMEGTGSGLQANRSAAAQLAPILRSSGHGLVLFPKGLNTTQKLIAKEGVPSATVFRDFDAKGQDARVIRRFLDQAAFRARQEPQGVIMVGRLRAETVSALLLWGLQDRAQTVALAPVSAVLTESP